MACHSAEAAANGGRAQAPPNIVIMYPDNLGYGEVGIYGGNRGVPTPRIDALSRQGMRLTNFNVETFCTPSRAALLTGRYGVRSGTLGYTQPWSGMTLWETTLAELLAPLRLHERAVRQVASGKCGRALPDKSRLRRVVRHPGLEQRVAAQHDERHALHLGGQGRRAVAAGEGIQPRDATRRSIARPPNGQSTS